VLEPEVYPSFSPAPGLIHEAPPAPSTRRLGDRIAALTDTQVTWLSAAVLFVLSAWPLLLVALPPFQDLPNHLATAHIVEHPELFPQYVFNGFFKSNCLLTLWFHLLGDGRLFLAARLFTALTLALMSWALPVFFLHFAGRRSLPAALLFGWPLVHQFFVSMGFLNFVCAFALSLVLLVVLDRQRQAPTVGRGLAIALFSCVIWYAHLFPLVVVGALTALYVLQRPDRRARLASAAALLLPLVPAGLLSLVAAEHHLIKADRAPAAILYPLFSYPSVVELIAHLWRDVSGALTRWGSMSLVPALLLPVFAWRGRRLERPFFSKSAMALLAGAYLALPIMMSNWCYLNCRLVPFLWIGLILHVPADLPRRLAVGLTACAVAFSLVLGADYVRLDRDTAEFTAGLDAVPRGTTLLPLLFKRKKTADFVASLAHTWGYYTVRRDVPSNLVFAVERSYPITWRQFPPRKLVPPTFDQFAEKYATPAQVCKALGQPSVDVACTAAWHDVWKGFWQEAEPRYAHLLTWAMPAEARSLIPPAYHRTFAAGDLEIYARDDAGPTAEAR
jgi:hypothetical protein